MSPCQGLSSLVLTGDIFMKPSLPTSDVVGERVDVWTLRVKSIAVEASHADVPDNRPLSGRFVDWSWSRRRRLAHEPPSAGWSAATSPHRSEVAVNGGSPNNPDRPSGDQEPGGGGQPPHPHRAVVAAPG